ncbi:YfcC family protein [Alkaliphilus peptidifermentans]|uniref:Uncharacterized membrane protein YfcC, ion transporter superfamily n=1 Tax=Alkaliphilus peptidifermentans DSM 18978 TaxID=1120976 RepID=A0A1G5KAG7_9FIRM|nr:Na+/H+ antiporter NhaC family protein [Alkaliphilus peptidifermentans]SCY97596.1 Uncharacterized membrane protein YfcC, ion transporter superfamily [Alkaliphilus peptidifermentans DSM 18978]
MSSESVAKKKFKVPHTYVIIFSIVIIAFLGTYFIPAGTYDRVQDPNSGRTVVDPASYHRVEQTPVKFFSFEKPHLFTSVHQGMQASNSIIFFILIVGGAFAMIQGTGAIDAGIGRAALALKDKGSLIIPAMMFIFGLGGATIGMAEETIVFVPIGIALARALGYDAIVGIAMITLGAAAGFTGGFMNPFTVGVAQTIAEVPMFSALGFRIAIFIVTLIIGAWYVMRYAKKVKENPESSVVYDLEKESKANLDLSAIPELNGRHYGVFAVMVVGFVIMIYGIKAHDWYIQELTSLFLMMGIFASLVGGVRPSKAAGHFVEGAKGIAFGALVVGIARAILVVMESGQIIDTIIHATAAGISSLPSVMAALLMYVVQVILNFFIPSGSGQAATTMPIMAPLADLVGVTRQTAVLAYQFGDGFTNSIIPTSAVLMSYLAIGKVPYEKWFKWILPLMGMWIGSGAVFLIIATLINLQ